MKRKTELMRGKRRESLVWYENAERETLTYSNYSYSYLRAGVYVQCTWSRRCTEVVAADAAQADFFKLAYHVGQFLTV